LGLRHRRELRLAVAVDHHGVPQPFFEGGDLLAGSRELAAPLLLPCSDIGAIDRQGDRIGFPIDTLAADGAVVSVAGNVAVLAVENEESAGDVRGDGYHAHEGWLLPRTGG